MSYVGQSMPMMTNAQLAAGKGTFVDDVQLPGMTFMAVLRSPHAHARIRPIDVSAAAALPGVLQVVTGEEIGQHTNPIPETYDTAAVGAKGVNWYALCVDRVRFVGEAVAAVVAEDRFTAYEALDLIEVDYEELPAVADPEKALEPDAPLVEPDWGDNLMASRDIRLGDPDTGIRGCRRRRQGRRQVRPDHGCRDRAPRVCRLLGPVQGDADLLGLDSGTTRGPHVPREDAGHPGHVDPRHPAARRRRIRAEAPDLPGGASVRLPLDESRPAGEVDRDARREPARRRPRPRHELPVPGRATRTTASSPGSGST